MAKLETIEGIGSVLADKLRAAGVGSVEKLLEEGGTRAGRSKLEKATGIEHKRILRFVNCADLMRIKGVGEEYSELLEAAGVDSVPELAQRNAESLHQKLEEANEKRKLVRSVAGVAQVEKWVAEAKSLPKAVHH